jgi:hypothetical protein
MNTNVRAVQVTVTKEVQDIMVRTYKKTLYLCEVGMGIVRVFLRISDI